MESHHRRRQVCHTRPAYRDGRKEKAVKVYTINSESRYLLVQGVPALKLTKELLDVCSLYGAIQEYRLLDDFPEKEEFTEVYWIQYQQLQAARVAKRKLDDRPFYGGTLHVCYAPEYETIDDTRQKLQDRRKAVAKRIRILDAEQRDTAKESSRHDTTADLSGGFNHGQENQPACSEGTESKICSTSSANQSSTTTESGSSETLQNSLLDVATDTSQTGIYFPQLPLPPKTLPMSEWTGPDRPNSEFPRLPSAHATLPRGFNPYPKDKPTAGDNLPKVSQQPQLHPKELGPHLPSGSLHTSHGGEPTTSSDFNREGAKPKISMHGQHLDADIKRLGRKRQSSDLYKSSNQQLHASGPDSNTGHPVKKRALDRCSFPRAHQKSSSLTQDVSMGRTQGGVRSVGFLPRQVQAQQRALPGAQGLGLEQLDSVGLPTGDVRHKDTAPNTGDASLDNTVQDIRNRLRAVTEAGAQASNSSSALSAASDPVVAQQAERPAQQRPAQQRQPRKARRKI